MGYLEQGFHVPTEIEQKIVLQFLCISERCMQNFVIGLRYSLSFDQE